MHENSGRCQEIVAELAHIQTELRDLGTPPSMTEPLADPHHVSEFSMTIEQQANESSRRTELEARRAKLLAEGKSLPCGEAVFWTARS
jgi:hypothetical protein